MSAYQVSSESLSTQLAQAATNLRFRMNQDQALSSLNPMKPVTILGHTLPPSPPIPFRSSLHQHLHRLPWSSYRSRFHPILGLHNHTYTSDVGWGCTIRVAQMVLLQALSRHLQIPFHVNPFILACFITEFGDNSVFSIHRFVEIGKTYFGRNAGEWQSPASVSCVLQLLVAQNSLVPNLTVHIGTDGVISKAEILANMTGLSEEDIICVCGKQQGKECPMCSEFLWSGGVLVLVPVMLGQQKLAPGYYEAVRKALSSPYSLGIIGAKPSSALHLVGYQEDHLLCLDPHYVQKSPATEDKLLKHIDTYQCPSIRCLPFSSIESSMSLAFFFSSSEDFESFATWLHSDALHEVIHVKHVKDRTKCGDSELVFFD